MFFRRKPQPAHQPRIPSSQRVYAIGDIHGRVDLLQDLHQRIEADQQGKSPATLTIIYLGDYVDRGEHSKQVLDLLVDAPPPAGATPLYLKGNHEQAMLEFLDAGVAVETAKAWLAYGGKETLLSYGVHVSDDTDTHTAHADMRRQLLQYLPEKHRQFLERLQLSYQIGDYFFAHAGIDPMRLLDNQDTHDLLWIREPFLSSRKMYEKVVVHGHTISAKAEILPNRIGIDTGAYASGILTALVLEDIQQRLIQT